MKYRTLIAALVTACTTTFARGLAVDVKIYSGQTNGGPSSFSVNLAVMGFSDPYFGTSPFGYVETGSLQLISPLGTQGNVIDVFSDPWINFQGASLAETLAQVNGRWTVRLADSELPQTDYYFDVGLGGLDFFEHARVNITSPSPGSRIEPRPTITYTSDFTSAQGQYLFNYQSLDIYTVSGGSFTYPYPLSTRTYDLSIWAYRITILPGEVFTAQGAGQLGDGPPLTFEPGQRSLDSYAWVTGVYVPEPASIATFGLSGTLLLTRRRRKSSAPCQTRQPAH